MSKAKAPQANSGVYTMLIMDQSPAGLKYAGELAADWAPVKDRLSKWRASNEAFFVFILEQWEGGHDRSMTAMDIDHLLSDVLPTLFRDHLMPPALSGFGVAADEADRIWTAIDHLYMAASPASTRRHRFEALRHFARG